jgi:hypothetical protein
MAARLRGAASAGETKPAQTMARATISADRRNSGSGRLRGKQRIICTAWNKDAAESK